MDAPGAQIAASNVAGIADERIQFNADAGHTYYLAVRPVGAATSDYELTSSFVDIANVAGETQDRAGNSIAAATTIEVPQTLAASVGFGADTTDVYRVIAPTTGTLVVQVGNLGQDVDVYVFNSLGNQIGRSENANTENEQALVSVIGGATYYVEVRPFQSAQSNYSLSVDIQAATTSDAGNSFDAARIYDINQDFAGTVGYGTDSNDFFKFVAPADGLFSARMTGLTADLDLYLYDIHGNRLAAPFATGTTAETVSQAMSAGDVYYLRIAPFQGAASAYNVDLSFQATGNAIDAADDGNNTRLGAIETTLPFARLDSTGFGADTRDYFKFTAAANGTVTIDLTGLKGDLDLLLYNAAGAVVARSEQSDAASEQIVFQVTIGAQYTIGVEPYQGDRSVYRLAAVFEADAPDTDGSFAAARTINAQATINDKVGYGLDSDDYYRIVAPADGILVVELSGLKADLDLELFNVQGQSLDLSQLTGRQDEIVGAVVAAGQTYYVRVNPFLAARSTYTLTTDLFVPNDSAGNSIATSILVPIPSHQRGIVGVSDDTSDVFSFIAPAAGTLTLELRPLAANADLRLMDAAGIELAASRVTGTAFDRISYALTAGTRYFVDVVADPAAATIYDILFGFQDAATAAAAKPTDPFFANQWHLFNTGQTNGTVGVDLSVAAVWSDYTGRGISVGVYDSGVEFLHPDLRTNYSDRATVQDAFGIHTSFVTGVNADAHGTAVAGIIVADNNGIGVVGVAYDATVGGLFFLDPSLSSTMSTSFLNQQSIYDVVNHSWGYPNAFISNASRGGSLASQVGALASSAANGRGGRGTVMVFAAGNDRAEGNDANYSNLANSPYVIAVAAADHNGDVSSYSSPAPTFW